MRDFKLVAGCLWIVASIDPARDRRISQNTAPKPSRKSVAGLVIF